MPKYQAYASLHAGLIDGIDHVLNIGQRCRERLLAEDVLPVSSRAQHEIFVPCRWHRYVDYVDIRRVDDFCRVRRDNRTVDDVCERSSPALASSQTATYRASTRPRRIIARIARE